MPNPILEQINNKNVMSTQNPTDNYIQGLRQFAQTLKNNQSSQAMLQNLVLQNPRLKDAMSFIQSMNSPEEALIAMAKQKGLDPNKILSAIKNL